ncbi:1836_t:CDS:10 [Paraglomus occultum]|uniref:ATP-dependent DNA helicase II subunit 2 n=1 Tax=Paraglomus occultum TaxID=144539 RepID=A0A9N8ZVL0_9GLOM|nr:1836_t:CDS:10 [Paraglomus occultum]
MFGDNINAVGFFERNLTSRAEFSRTPWCSKKATAYVIDVSPSMWQAPTADDSLPIELAKKAVVGLLDVKLLANAKTDITSVLAVGTDDTDYGPIEDFDEDYEHIKVITGLEMPTLDLLRTVQHQLPQGNAPGNCLDGISAAIEIIKRHCRHLKYEKKIFLMTDGESPMSSIRLQQIVDELRNNGIEIFVLGIGFSDPDEDTNDPSKSQTKLANEDLFRDLVSRAPGSSYITPMDSALEEISQPYVRPVRPTPLYRGALTISNKNEYGDSALGVNVTMYARTKKASLPSFKKWSVLAENAQDNQQKTHEVLRTYSYTVWDDENGVEVHVDKEDLMKAYPYGATLVPAQNFDEEQFKLDTNMALDILGFVRVTEINKDLFLGETLSIVPQKEDRASALAFSALAHAMYEKNLIGLARFVKRIRGPPVMLGLIPHITAERELIYGYMLPFNEDIRYYEFPPLDRVQSQKGEIRSDHPLLPSPELSDKMRQFIEQMDLMNVPDEDGQPTEYLHKKQFNPTAVLIKKSVNHRALNPGAELPPPDESVLSILKPLPDMINRNQSLADELAELCDIVKSQEKQKRSRRDRGEEVEEEEVDIDELFALASDEQSKRTRREEGSGSSMTVGREDPIRDFEAMVAYRAEDLVTTAVEQMCAVIKEFISGDDLEKHALALNCIKVLRNACTKENESDTFNNFLRELRDICLHAEAPRTDFWNQILQEQISLISTDEAIDSSTSINEAQQFLQSASSSHQDVEMSDV